MRIEFHSAAGREVIEIAGYYEFRRPGLGADFLGEIARPLDLLSRNPQIGVALGAPYLRLVLDRFPFSVIYLLKGSALRVAAVAHHRRKPGYWMERE